jgi:hypothetical protein
MPLSYATYTNISVNALEFNPKSQDIIAKKQEIITSIAQHYSTNPLSILFIGFSSLILGVTYKQIFVTEVTEETKNYLNKQGIKYTYIDSADLPKHQKQFNWVIASDEYFTFAKTEEEQRQSIELLASLAKDLIVTTLRDYKNQDFKDREFSQPLVVHNHNEHKVFLEYHNYDYNDRNAWTTTVYELQGSTSKMYGPFDRRAMFFKQMAKFSLDAGAKNFLVHKNLMYKSLIKKNYEHVISISF